MADAVNEEQLQLKKRARRRLVGAVVLVLLAFLLLPRILEHQPKPVQKDVAIQLPSSVEPGKAVDPPAQIAGLPQASSPAVESPKTVPTESAPPPKNLPVPATKVTQPSALPEPAGKPVAKPRPAPATVAKAESSQIPSATPAQEFDVQLGAFSKSENATRLMQKLKDANFNAFVETIKTGSGTKTRVRAGPYASREAAEKARSKLIALKLTSGSPRVVRHR